MQTIPVVSLRSSSLPAAPYTAPARPTLHSASPSTALPRPPAPCRWQTSLPLPRSVLSLAHPSTSHPPSPTEESVASAPTPVASAPSGSGLAAPRSLPAARAFQPHPKPEKTTNTPQPTSWFVSWGHPSHLQLKKSRFSLGSGRGVLLTNGDDLRKLSIGPGECTRL